MNDKRPVNLDLTTIRFPITAIVSITHRISGVILYGGIAVLLWMLQASLASEQSFNELKELLGSPLLQFIVWGTVAALAYHLVMGVRHMIMDLGVGESLEGGRRGAQIAIVVAVILIVLAGVWVW
ncbi:succinate dehydrogenase, cytochrome b556 subunit [Gilvimarinus sp. F26214L]|uniref:succinate dehydrogenase, cytochrome b556 subunit n=1 Tax=Gilvimarinus sp. DZF01 TaxID=3461371 RepID=UPI004046294D